ncbi:MAG: hypothetical protein Q4D45_02510 [Lachnospiraceae bacterium]|nr:hypothetical protein [Lachnospiraceae bacterium]
MSKLFSDRILMIVLFVADIVLCYMQLTKKVDMIGLIGVVTFLVVLGIIDEIILRTMDTERRITFLRMLIIFLSVLEILLWMVQLNSIFCFVQFTIKDVSTPMILILVSDIDYIQKMNKLKNKFKQNRI